MDHRFALSKTLTGAQNKIHTCSEKLENFAVGEKTQLKRL